MSEKNFWVLLRNKLPIKMYRVENKVMKGMPDIHYLKNGESGWIELKYIRYLPKKRVSAGLKLNQSLWAKDYVSRGGKSWIMIRIQRSHTILVKGEHSNFIYKRPNLKEILQISSWYKIGNMEDKDWDELASILTIP